MKYDFQVRTYERVFKKPLITKHFVLNQRQGLIIRLEDEKKGIGFGEIAPFEYFGSESLEEAKRFCLKIGPSVEEQGIPSIPIQMPCTRFAFESAREMLKGHQNIPRNFEVAALISLEDNLDELNAYRNFKCKIGRYDFEKEKDLFLKLIERLPQGSTLRLDANGTLTRKVAQKWLTLLEKNPVQFLEQPLPKGQEDLMTQFGADYQTAIALDESVAGIEDFQKILELGWNQWIVVKPILVGDLVKFRNLRDHYKDTVRIVYSSVFETGIGTDAILRIAASDDNNDYAIGFGTNAYFKDDEFNLYPVAPVIRYGESKKQGLERIWDLCRPLI